MKQFLKNISPFNNRTEMPAALFVVKKILAFRDAVVKIENGNVTHFLR